MTLTPPEWLANSMTSYPSIIKTRLTNRSSYVQRDVSAVGRIDSTNYARVVFILEKITRRISSRKHHSLDVLWRASIEIICRQVRMRASEGSIDRRLRQAGRRLGDLRTKLKNLSTLPLEIQKSIKQDIQSICQIAPASSVGRRAARSVFRRPRNNYRINDNREVVIVQVQHRVHPFARRPFIPFVHLF